MAIGVSLIKGALLFVPGGALAAVDDAIVIGIHLIEALAETAVALGQGHRREIIIIRLLPFKPGAPLRVEVFLGKLGSDLGLALFDEMQPPVAVLLVAGVSAGGAAIAGAASAAAIRAELASVRILAVMFMGLSRPGCSSGSLTTPEEQTKHEIEGDYILD